MARSRSRLGSQQAAAIALACLLAPAAALSGTLKASQQYGSEFTSKEGGDTRSDIMVTAYADPGGDIDLKCRPLSAPSNSEWVWQSRLPAGTERLFISAYDPAFQRTGREGDHGVFCMVENTSTPPKPVNFEMDVIFGGTTPMLKDDEQKALKNIYDKCCKDDDACRVWKGVDNQSEEGRSNDAGPFLDFCHMQKQGCDGRGRLLQLNMDGWGLKCDFPSKDFASFPALKVLRIGDGHDLKGEAAEIMDELSAMINLELLHLEGNTRITGSLAKDGSDSAGICKLSKSLSLLQLAGNGVSGSIPKCLMDSSSNLAFVDLGMNSLSGPIPDRFWPEGHLTDLFLDNNNLEGPLPASLGELPFLHTFNVSFNKIDGSIPEEVGNAPSLMQFFANGNKISGSLPSSFAAHPNLTSIDLSDNELEGLPAEWYSMEGMDKVRLGSIRMANNKISGELPRGLNAIPLLTRLNLANNNFDGELPVLGGGADNFPNMLFYNVSNNHLTGVIPEEYGEMRLFKSEGIGIVNADGSRELFTFIFDVSGNDLSGNLPSFLSKKEVEGHLKWTDIDAAGNDFDNKCDVAYEYMGVCGQQENRDPVEDEREGVTAEEETGGDGGLSGGAIAGIVIGSVVGALLLIVLVVLLVRRCRGGNVAMPVPSSSSAANFERFDDGGN